MYVSTVPVTVVTLPTDVTVLGGETTVIIDPFSKVRKVVVAIPLVMVEVDVVTSTLEIPVMSHALSISGVVLLFTIVTVQTPLANEQEVKWANSSPARGPP